MNYDKRTSCKGMYGDWYGNLCDEYLELSEVYSHLMIPVTVQNIPSQEDVMKWPYLHQVKISHIAPEIGLLIWNNVPKALDPWRLINSQENGPCFKNHSWVDGPLARGEHKGVIASRISLFKLEELLQQQMKYDFPEGPHKERLEMSQEDHAFMEKVSHSIQLHEGHYSIRLPLRNDKAEFPNNRCLAEQRALSLKAKLLKTQNSTGNTNISWQIL